MSGRNGGNGSEVVAKICKVCDGKATGFHFGVMSCEGCKVSSWIPDYHFDLTELPLNFALIGIFPPQCEKECSIYL